MVTPGKMAPGEHHGRKNRGFLGYDSSALPSADARDRSQLRFELDLNSWNLRIWGVAASGFLTDSYNLFATNVISASISFVYWPDDKWPSLVINLCTLIGSVVGQLLFGFLADYYGRTRLYGIELILVIVSTIGVATSSYGYNDMSFLGLFAWWRFVMGVGIGAEYPLSAVITSEWSSTKSRATMLSSVFLMQPVGQALAQLVGLWVIIGRQNQYDLVELQCGLNTLHEEECKKIVDGVWRIVAGSGAVPAVLAIIFRFFLYDCGLYSLEVKNKAQDALRNTRGVYGVPETDDDEISTASPGNGLQMSSPDGLDDGMAPVPSPRIMPVQFSKEDLYHFLITDGNWYYLLGTSATWFMLDVSFYGFSLDNRGVLADMWATSPATTIDENLSCWESSLEGGTSVVPGWAETGLPSWSTDANKPCFTIYDVLFEQAKHYLLTVSIASIAGSACFIAACNYIHRRRFLTTSFFTLGIMFIVTGGVFYGVYRTEAAPATLVFVALCHFLFNFGANTLTFIIPAEIFPTAYRCSCHGISAAAGKLGSILAVLIVFGINEGYNSDTKQGLIFILFGSFMFLGMIFSWAYLPDVQRWRVLRRTGKKILENRSLEDLGEGRGKARIEGEVITISEKLTDLKQRRTTRRLGSQEV
ncbi:phosphate transporter [Zalerion maritima]|uniref:Phosphate transporter n=1 Tax=Zalerion maritima TaxID=339359 RepID=A0AAD5RWI4_9PEZI|nr:phosphate transporter [Zalerion maritima]